MNYLNIRVAVICAVAALFSMTAQADPPEKQMVCHQQGKSEVIQLEVGDEAAEKGHLKHGDHPPQTFFADADGDGFGAGAAKEACTQPAGWVAMGGDCKDSDAAIKPGIAEVCKDTIDNNCDGQVDEGCVTEPPMSHKVNVLLHCDPGSSVLGTYEAGTHTLPWNVYRNISFIHFVDGSQGSVTLHHCDGRTMKITADTNLCALPGGCCGAGRWNDSVCKITVE